jgi:hypothetical protein
MISSKSPLFSLAIALSLGLLTASTPLYAEKDSRPSAHPVTVNTQAHDELTRITFPIGATLLVSSESHLSTLTNQVNDVITARLQQNIWVNQQLVLPKNTRLIGNISTLNPPLSGRNALIALAFTEALLPNGDRLPLQTKLITPNKEGVLGGEPTEPETYRLVRYDVWGIGLYNRAWKVGPLAMGKHIEVPAGETLRLMLTAPLTVVTPTNSLF